MTLDAHPELLRLVDLDDYATEADWRALAGVLEAWPDREAFVGGLAAAVRARMDANEEGAWVLPRRPPLSWLDRADDPFFAALLGLSNGVGAYVLELWGASRQSFACGRHLPSLMEQVTAFARDEFEVGDCIGNPVAAVPEVILHSISCGWVIGSASHDGGFATVARVAGHPPITLDPTGRGMPSDEGSLHVVAALRHAAADGDSMPRLDLDFSLPELPPPRGDYDPEYIEGVGVEAWRQDGEPAWPPHLWPLLAEPV